MIKKNTIEQKAVIFSLIFIIIILSLTLTFGIIRFSNYLEKDKLDDLLIIEDYSLYSDSISIYSNLDDIGDELWFLENLETFQNLINNKFDDGINLHYINYLFKQFIKNKKAYYQLRYIDETGMEKIRIEFDGEEYFSVPEEDLQNKSDRYYFKETLALNDGEVYLSDFDLNLENGKIEVRDFFGFKGPVSVVRFGTSVFDEFGNRKGIIIVNVFLEYLFRELRYNTNEDETKYIVDSSGEYKFNKNRDKEFGYLTGSGISFFSENPNVPRNIFQNKSMTFYEMEDKLFIFKSITPELSNFKIVHSVDSDNYLILVSEITK